MGKVRKKRRGKTTAAISAASNPLHGGAQKSELLRIRQAQQEPGLSRGKRRRLAQRERRATKAELVKVLSKQATRDESVRMNGQMGDMSDMSSSLLSLLDDLKGGASLLDATRGTMGAGVAGTESGTATDSKKIASNSAEGSGKAGRGRKTMTNKTRSRIAAAEADNLSMVVNHAAFQANPLAAIREHLKNTLGK